MQKEEPTLRDRVQQLEEDIKLLQGQLATFQDILSSNETTWRLANFDAYVEQEIAEIFGSSSKMLEAYVSAKRGESAGWMNLPQEAQEFRSQDFEGISLKQRSRVLEWCIANLKTRRSILMDLNTA